MKGELGIHPYFPFSCRPLLSSTKRQRHAKITNELYMEIPKQEPSWKKENHFSVSMYVLVLQISLGNQKQACNLSTQGLKSDQLLQNNYQGLQS